MKTLPKTITALVISGIIASAAFAVPAFAKGGYSGAKIERMAEKLELSEAQTVSFTEIMTAQKEKRKALKEQDISREEKREQMQALRAETFASLETILSEEQLAKVQDMMKRGKKHRHGDKGDKEDTAS